MTSIRITDLIRVFDGKAVVQVAGQRIQVKSGHQLNLDAVGKLKPRKFDKKAYTDDFYRWASLRASYLAEANVDSARTYGGGVGWSPTAWYGDGWYWNPGYGAYTFIPGDGIFLDPFGWGFYSPWSAFEAPYWGYGYGYGFVGGATVILDPATVRATRRVVLVSGVLGTRPASVVVWAPLAVVAVSAAAVSAAGRGFRGTSGGGFRGGGGVPRRRRWFPWRRRTPLASTARLPDRQLLLPQARAFRHPRLLELPRRRRCASGVCPGELRSPLHPR